MVPDSEIWLCRNTRLTPGSEDTYYFSSESARSSFFIGKSSEYAPQLHFADASYIRTDKYVQLPVSYIDAAFCDYCVFKNTNYSSKLFYAFITSVEYINDKTTRIYFEIDPVQTWLPSLTLSSGQSISRETVLSDNYGENELDEGLAAGDLTVYRRTAIGNGSDYATYRATVTVVAVKRLPVCYNTLWSQIALHSTVTGVCSKGNNFWGESAGLDCYVYEAPLLPKQNLLSSLFYVCFLGAAPERLSKFLRLYTGEVTYADPTTSASTARVTSDDVVGIFKAPAYALPADLRTAWRDTSAGLVGIVGGSGFTVSDAAFSSQGVYLASWPATFSNNTTNNITVDQGFTSGMFGGYQPKNKKCYQYPFCQITLDTMLGTSETFRPERFNSGQILGSAIINSTGAETYLEVTNYNNEDSYMHVLTINGYPAFPWNTNSFSEWYGLHGAAIEHSQSLAMFEGLSGLAGALKSGSVAGTVSSLVGLGDTEFQYKQNLLEQAAASPKSHGSSTGNFYLRASDHDYPVLLHMCAHDDAVRAADVYFTKYGYRVDRIGSIHFTGRSRFNYVKLSGPLQGSGNIPGKARDELSRLFMNGLRFWHGNYLADYSVDNTITD